jgi:hypothetical protein
MSDVLGSAATLLAPSLPFALLGFCLGLCARVSPPDIRSHLWLLYDTSGMSF